MMIAADEVLNSMFFVGVQSSLEKPDEPDDDWIVAKVTFRGCESGQFGIGAPLATARMLASNFLGQDEGDLQDSQVIEVFCELSNMICGAYLGGGGSNSVCDLSHPKLDSSFLCAQPGVVCQFLQLDEGRMRVWLAMEPVS